MKLTGTAAGLVLAAATLMACAPDPGVQSEADSVGAIELAGVTYFPLLVSDRRPERWAARSASAPRTSSARRLTGPPAAQGHG
jgi:hypothetical protein